MESGLNSDTVQVEILPDEISAVFVDSTGKRRRRFRTLGFVAGGIAAAYGVMLGLSFAGGPINPHALLPVPGVPTVAPINNGPQRGNSLTPVSEGQLSRTSGNKSDTRIGATSTPVPRITISGGKVVVVPPPTSPAVIPTAPGTPTPTPVKTTPPVVTTTPPVITSPTPPVKTTPPPADPPTPPASSPPADPPTTTPPVVPPAGGGGGGSAPSVTASATVTETVTASPTASVTVQAANLES